VIIDFSLVNENSCIYGTGFLNVKNVKHAGFLVFFGRKCMLKNCDSSLYVKCVTFSRTCHFIGFGIKDRYYEIYLFSMTLNKFKF